MHKTKPVVTGYNNHHVSETVFCFPFLNKTLQFILFSLQNTAQDQTVCQYNEDEHMYSFQTGVQEYGSASS